MRISDLMNIVKQAGTLVCKNFRQPVTIVLKNNGSPVTNVDMLVHDLLFAFSQEHNIGYIGEEGNGDVDHEYILYVDPLDGTSSFRAGIPTVTIAVSLMKRQSGNMYEPVMAIIHEPLTGWTWVAEAGCDTVVYDRDGEASLAKVDTTAEQKLITRICPPGHLRHLRDGVYAEINARQPAMKHQECGSLALCAGLIASGMLHGIIDTGTSAVEEAAMSLVVKGAGGIVTDLSGEPLNTFVLGENDGKLDFMLPNGSIMTCNPEINATLVEIIKIHL